MSENLEICEPDARFLAIRKLIDKEDAPLLEDLGPEIVARLQEIASTKGKANRELLCYGNAVKKIKGYLDSIPDNLRGTADTIYRKFRRAWRGFHVRHGKLYYVDADGNEMRTADYIAAQTEDGETPGPVIMPKQVPEEFRL